jgi:cysteine synthase A
MIAPSVEALIGNTPLVRMNHLSDSTGTTILGKCEFMNPTSSVKDRIAYHMIEEAFKQGKITEKTTIIEPTSGNTGIGLAAVCAARGLKLILTMPESMSIERQKLLTHLGATLVLTPAAEGMNGAIAKAQILQQELGDAFILQQFQNPDNPNAHKKTTAIEILNDTQHHLDIFVASVGTGGTLTGTAERLKEELPALEVVAVEPANAAVLEGKPPHPHAIQGIGAGFIPPILNQSLYQRVIAIEDEEAFMMAREVAKNEGLLVGISSGANLAAAYKLAKEPQNRGKTIVTILCDTAERYLSTPLFE